MADKRIYNSSHGRTPTLNPHRHRDVCFVICVGELNVPVPLSFLDILRPWPLHDEELRIRFLHIVVMLEPDGWLVCDGDESCVVVTL